MEKDQDQKLVCKVCGKSCSSGMSLGGHMRSHLPKKSSAKKAKGHNSLLAFSQNDDDDINNDHVIREKTRTYLKLSTEENEIKCKECGKEFPSVRSLCGHMRWHSVKIKEENHECRECGKVFDSERALFGHMTHHFRKLKVSNESAYSFSDDSEGENENFFPSFDIDRDEIQEAAVILIMISQGLTQRDLSNLVLKKSDGAKLRKKLASWVTSSKMDVSDDGFDQDDDFGNELSSLEIKNGKRKRVETDENLAEIKSKGLKKSKRHACRICSKVFHTRKGLGGHKKAHKNDVFENRHEALLISNLAN